MWGKYCVTNEPGFCVGEAEGELLREVCATASWLAVQDETRPVEKGERLVWSKEPEGLLVFGLRSRK